MPTTRFAPSPTGDLHIGGVRTALFSYLAAKQKGGEFKLRIEDTDQERSTEASVKVILEGLDWLGIHSDAEIIYQSQRFDIYNRIIDEMIKKGQAYYCWCSPEELEAMREEQKAKGLKPKYNGKHRDNQEPVEGVNPVVRFKNPLTGSVSWEDKVRGLISISNEELDDWVIRRSDGTPTYNFCVVIDDAEQNIDLVIRGEDHISNTPKQINLYQALGYKIPEFAHVPMILGDDGKRLSKRHGATNVLDYKKEGYLPEAILNYLARLGWAYGDQEIFTMEELLEKFKITDVHSAPSTFNTQKLNWLNQQYLIKADVNKLAQLLDEYTQPLGFVLSENTKLMAIPHYVERSKTLKEMAENLVWLEKDPIFSELPEKAKAKAFKGENVAELLENLAQRLENLDNFNEENVHKALEDCVNHFGVGFGKVGQPARLALTGGSPSPDLAISFVLAGKEKSIRRLKNCLENLKGQP